MKTTNGFATKLDKRCLGIIISALTMCFCVILITFILAGCSSSENADANKKETTTSTTTSAPAIDEEAYTFSEGIFLGSADVSKKSYKDARAAAQAEINSLIKDFSIIVNVDNSEHSFTNKDFKFDNNIEEALLQAKDYNDKLGGKASSEKKVFALTFNVNKESVNSVVAGLAKNVDIAAVDATISGAKNGKVTISEAKVGKKLDQTKLAGELITAINALCKGDKGTTKFTAAIATTNPTVTHDDLDQKITLLSSYTTVSTNNANGNHNMKLALDSCDGSIIKPGATWSFNACTGNSNLTSLGYLPATVIIGGKLVDGIGGGLCQSSTTIYNAAIRTNMEIVERYYHYYQSTYAPAGLDATIDYPNLDLKLKNPTDYPMYMQCYMEGKTLYCNIYGYQDPSFDKVVIDSYVYDANPDQNYYRAAASRTFYKDGKVVKTEQLPSSKYAYKTDEDSTTAPSTTAPAKPTEAPTTLPPSSEVTTPVEPTIPTIPTDPTEAPTPPSSTAPPEEVPTDRVEY